MIKLNNFTWGFELEGVFARSIVEKVYRLGLKKGFRIEGKYDGSVNDALISAADFETERDNEGAITEINVGVFKRFDEMVKVLEAFNRKNYISDDSCGLHIHIKPKAGKEFLNGQIFDSDFIENIQHFAWLLCDHIRGERMENRYCLPAKTFSRKLRNYKYKTKYTFMGNHPQGTTEFRFFSACNHKADNVKKFFKYFGEKLGKKKIFVKKFLFERPVVNTYAPYEEQLYCRNKTLRETVKLETNKKINLCV